MGATIETVWITTKLAITVHSQLYVLLKYFPNATRLMFHECQTVFDLFFANGSVKILQLVKAINTVEISGCKISFAQLQNMATAYPSITKLKLSKVMLTEQHMTTILEAFTALDTLDVRDCCDESQKVALRFDATTDKNIIVKAASEDGKSDELDAAFNKLKISDE